VQSSEIKKSIRQVPDFPKPGILFYDVATLFRDARAFRAAVEGMVPGLAGRSLDAIAGIEARGFVLASALAYRLGLGLVIVRKHGKLPGQVEGETYALEYGEAHLEIQRDALAPGSRVMVVDDLLATGGTAAAAGRLVERLGARLEGYAFLVELAFLGGRQRLGASGVFSLLHYERPGL
jgi:adenine phosphoribosyltransferase